MKVNIIKYIWCYMRNSFFIGDMFNISIYYMFVVVGSVYLYICGKFFLL